MSKHLHTQTQSGEKKEKNGKGSEVITQPRRDIATLTKQVAKDILEVPASKTCKRRTSRAARRVFHTTAFLHNCHPRARTLWLEWQCVLAKPSIKSTQSKRTHSSTTSFVLSFSSTSHTSYCWHIVCQRARRKVHRVNEIYLDRDGIKERKNERKKERTHSQLSSQTLCWIRSLLHGKGRSQTISWAPSLYFSSI